MFPTRVTSITIVVPPKYRKVILVTHSSTSLEDNKVIVQFSGKSGKVPAAGF